MFLRQIFDPYLAQYAYMVGCQRTGEALVIDPERDIDRYDMVAAENGLRITAVAETHIHADFVSGAQEFAARPDVTVYSSGEGGDEWQPRWASSRPNVRLLRHGDRFSVGRIAIEAIHTPGHTPEHLSYLITDVGAGADKPIAIASGDFLFVGDVGRPDLLESAAGIKNVMEPSARTLAESLGSRLANLEDYIQVLPGHGAGSACGKSLGAVPISTLGYERRFNEALRQALSDRSAFVKEILSGQPEPPVYFARMKQVNRDGASVTGGVPVPLQLSGGEFVERTKKGGRILDARADRSAFDAGHAVGSIYAPLRSPYFSVAAGSYFAPEEPILLVLQDAAEAEIAARQLYRIGFDRVEGWISVEEARNHGLLERVTKRLDFADLKVADAVKEGEIVDVRTKAEFESGHLSGARSIPYTRLRAHLHELPRDRKLFVHCASGRRAALAASFLGAEGFDVTHIDGHYGSCTTN